MKLSRNEAKTMLEALSLAGYELETLHGLEVTDNLPSGQTWTIDTDEVLKFVGRALDILERKKGEEA